MRHSSFPGVFDRQTLLRWTQADLRGTSAAEIGRRKLRMARRRTVEGQCAGDLDHTGWQLIELSNGGMQCGLECAGDELATRRSFFRLGSEVLGGSPTAVIGEWCKDALRRPRAPARPDTGASFDDANRLLCPAPSADGSRRHHAVPVSRSVGHIFTTSSCCQGRKCDCPSYRQVPGIRFWVFACSLSSVQQDVLDDDLPGCARLTLTWMSATAHAQRSIQCTPAVIPERVAPAIDVDRIAARTSC